MLLSDLPIELLTQCCSFLNNSPQAITNLRLVCRQFDAACAGFLIDRVTIFMNGESLSLLNRLSKHPVFRKSLKKVYFNWSYFCPDFATDKVLFSQNCCSLLYNKMEVYERSSMYSYSTPEGELNYTSAESILAEWEASPGVPDAGEVSGAFQILRGAYNSYHQGHAEQQRVLESGEYLDTIREAFSRFTNVRSIYFEDRVDSTYGGLSEEALLQDFSQPMTWKGTFQTPQTATPPAYLIPEIFQILHDYQICPRKFDVILTAPYNMMIFKINESQQASVRTVVQHAVKLNCRIQHWSRQNSLAVDNSRSQQEMKSLGSFTRAFFASERVENLTLELNDYPVFYERPTVGLSDLLPTERCWPRLVKLGLHAVPFHLAELSELLRLHANTLVNIKSSSPFLLSGTWFEAIECMKDIGLTEGASIRYGRGDIFGSGRGRSSISFPTVEINKYILGERRTNPLLNFKLEQ